VNAPAGPTRNHTGTRHAPTTEGPEATRTRLTGMRAIKAEDPVGPSPSAGSLNRSRIIPPATFGHDYKQQTATSVLTKLTRQSKNNTEQACAGALQRRCTETPTTQSRCEDGKWSQRINTAPRASNSPNTRTVAPQHHRSLGPRPYKKAGHLIERAEPCRILRHS
jgi:hypothetical protein